MPIAAPRLDASRAKIFRSLVNTHGLAEACRRIGITREVGARLLAGIVVRAGSVSLAVHGIDALVEAGGLEASAASK